MKHDIITLTQWHRVSGWVTPSTHHHNLRAERNGGVVGVKRMDEEEEEEEEKGWGAPKAGDRDRERKVMRER